MRITAGSRNDLRHLAASALAALVTLVAPAHVDAQNSARFRVLEEVVNPDLPKFSANLLYDGNGSELTRRGGGFEPILYRTRLTATEDSPNSVIASMQEITHFDTLRTGALDGAEVDVLRVENGAFRLVRQSVVPLGGHQASGWVPLLKREILSPGSTTFHFTWPGWSRPSVKQYFAIRAVDSDGRLSPPGRVLEVTNPAKLGGKAPENDLVKPDTPPNGELSGRLEAPQNVAGRLTRDGVLIMTWTPPPGQVAGYVVYMSDDHPARHRGYELHLSGDGPPIRAGDMILVRKKSYVASRRQMATNRIWNTRETNDFRSLMVSGFSDEAEGGYWELKPHDADTPVTDPGETYLSLTFQNGDGTQIGVHNHSGTMQSWYPVLDPARTYRFEFWMRGRSPRPAVVQFHGPYGSTSRLRIPPVSLRIEPQWKHYALDFKVPAVFEGKQAGGMFLSFEGSGQVDIDNIRIYSTEAPYMDLPADDVARLEQFEIPLLRTVAFIKTGRNTFDLDQLTNGVGGNGVLLGGQTLSQMFQTFERIGADPWLQIDHHLGPDEWLGLVEYLAAPVDPAGGTPWAEKRARTGHPQPWTETFDRILFELGNETWNNLFRPWTFDGMIDAVTGERLSRGKVYGLYQEYVLNIMRQSPYWPDLRKKLVVTVGGWSGFPYGANAAAASPSTDLMTVASYIGGWDEAEGPAQPSPLSFHLVLNAVNQSIIPRATRHAAEAAAIAAERGRPLAVGTYEAGPGYALNGLNRQKVTPEEADQQELVMKSMAAGTATLDSFLAQARLGYREQSFFGYGSGETWRSHASRARGGQTFPSWDLLGLFNRIGTGDLLNVETLEVPTLDLEKTGRREAVRDAPMVAAYATRKDDRLSLFVVSRRVPGYPTDREDGRTAVQVELPITQADSMTRYYMSGDYRSNNVFSREVEIRSETLEAPPNPATLDIDVLEPGQTLVFVYEGVR